MKVEITGASGFVGQNLILGLDNMFEILRLNLRNQSDENFHIHGDALIHLAGKAHDLKNTSNPIEYYEVNYELTKKIYNAFLKSDAQKFIFLSSVKASADVVNGTLTEESIPNPKTDYGKSKLLAEQYIQDQTLPDGKAYYILRPCMIHGPNNKGNLNLLYKFVEKGIPYPLASFINRRSFLSIENLCFVIEMLLKKEIPSGIYNVADDEALSTNELVEILSKSLNKNPKLWSLPKGLVYGIAKIGDMLHLPLTTERLSKLTESYVVCNNKIKKELRLSFPLTTKEGILTTANSFNNKI